MNKHLTTTFFTLIVIAMYGQDFAGIYKGIMQGEAVSLTLSNSGQNKYVGLLNDSHNDFSVTAISSSNVLTGVAQERNTGLEFAMEASLASTTLDMTLRFEYLGESSEMKVILSKENANQGSSDVSNFGISNFKELKLPSNAQHDINLVGRWTKNESYNSGSGDNFMGANFSQTMIIYGDGKIGQGGSSVNMSGSNYYGASSGSDNNQNPIPGLYWYNLGNQLYLFVSENGENREIHLGKYYIEGQNMLITGENGVKLLLSRN